MFRQVPLGNDPPSPGGISAHKYSYSAAAVCNPQLLRKLGPVRSGPCIAPRSVAPWQEAQDRP